MSPDREVINMVRKIIVTNSKAMRRKYGNTGWRQIKDAAAEMIRKDTERECKSYFVSMDLKTDMKKFDAPQVADNADEGQNKAAVDAIFGKARPDYLLILGAPDVVPHQSLTNPVGDDDLEVPSDLPYACEAPYSVEIADFKGPTRVIGRLPDVSGGGDPQYLLDLLDTATDWKFRTQRSYDKYLSVSADVWKRSTRKSVRKLFGSTTGLVFSPTAGPTWSKAMLKPRVHFINLHGAAMAPTFFGEGPEGVYPDAMHAENVSGRFREGTVISAECCYGAELYDPSFWGDSPGICNIAMASGVYGFWGSSSIAYGPADSNDYADLVCQYFVREMLKGASLGRASLMARQIYLQQAAPLDPVDLKTIAQFNLLGDPSVHPVKMSKTQRSNIAKSRQLGTVRARRSTLQRKGIKLDDMLASTRSRKDQKIDDKLRSQLIAIVEKQGLTLQKDVRSFAVHTAAKPALAKSRAARRKAAGEGVYHLLLAHRKAAEVQVLCDSPTKKKVAAVRKIRNDVVVLAGQFDDDLKVKTLFAR